VTSGAKFFTTGSKNARVGGRITILVKYEFLAVDKKMPVYNVEQR
jgi:hypothetical protein